MSAPDFTPWKPSFVVVTPTTAFEVLQFQHPRSRMLISQLHQEIKTIMHKANRKSDKP